MKFKVGDRVIAKQNNGYGVTTDGWEGTVIYACDRFIDARDNRDGLEYSHLKVERFIKISGKVGKEVAMKDIKWGVKFDVGGDPVEFFKTKKEAEKRIVELLDESDVDKSEIYLFEVGEKFKVDRPVNFELVKQ